ncbi:unnamed protein product [Lymnaea stagnalis]|uniref:Protein kinase domain-containing protein n=1 Tax=Lymnaea stagnalis TaxID=6523 RepID=A0AAV2HGT1_LYMST
MDGLLHQGHTLEPDIIQEVYHKIQTLQTHRSCVVVFGETSVVTNQFVKCLLEEVNMGAHPSVHKFMEHSSEKDAKHGDEEVRRTYSMVHSPSKISRAKISHRRRRLPLEDSRESDPGNIPQESVNLLILPEMVDDDVMSDVESAPATAFVFLLDEVQAEIHQKVRFKQVISNFHQMCSRDNTFDPTAAMFVIHAENFPPETQFTSYVSERLQRIWPGVCDRQVHLETFSRNSEMESPYDSSNTLMDAFYSMVQETELRKIRQTYFWLKSAIPSATAYVRSLIGQCVRADGELEPYHGAASRRQERLMVGFTDGIQQLEEGVEKQTKKLKESMLQSLDTASDNVKKKLKGFKLRADKTTDGNSVGRGVQHGEIDLVILNSLLGELSKADEIRDIITATELELVNVIQTQFDLLGHEVGEIIRNAVCIERERASEFDESNVDSMEGKQPLWAHDQILISHSVLDILRSDKKATDGHGETGEQLGDHWSLNDRLHEDRATLDEELRATLDEELRATMDEELFMVTRVHHLTIRVKHCDEAINAVIEDYLARARAYVASAKYKIARILSDNVAVVEDLCSCRETFQEGKVHLIQVMEELEPIRYMLEEFGTNFMEDESSCSVNMSQGEIVLTPCSDLWGTHQDSVGELCTDGDRNYFKGLWCRSQRTSVAINNRQENVLLRIYSQEVGQKVLISEVAQLRCLESSFTASFFGVLGKLNSEQDEEVPVWNGQLSSPWPVLIFRGDLVPCRMFVSILDQSKSNDSRSGWPAADSRAEFVMAFIASLLTALDYIHKYGLVHMELTLDTVMVERTTGDVKLCHICKPRNSALPKDTSVVKAEPYICLAPRVLRGRVYDQRMTFTPSGSCSGNCCTRRNHRIANSGAGHWRPSLRDAVPRRCYRVISSDLGHLKGCLRYYQALYSLIEKT